MFRDWSYFTPITLFLFDYVSIADICTELTTIASTWRTITDAWIARVIGWCRIFLWLEGSNYIFLKILFSSGKDTIRLCTYTFIGLWKSYRYIYIFRREKWWDTWNMTFIVLLDACVKFIWWLWSYWKTKRR